MPHQLKKKKNIFNSLSLTFPSLSSNISFSLPSRHRNPTNTTSLAAAIGKHTTTFITCKTHLSLVQERVHCGRPTPLHPFRTQQLIWVLVVVVVLAGSLYFSLIDQSSDLWFQLDLCKKTTQIYGDVGSRNRSFESNF